MRELLTVIKSHKLLYSGHNSRHVSFQEITMDRRLKKNVLSRHRGMDRCGNCRVPESDSGPELLHRGVVNPRMETWCNSKQLLNAIGL